MAGVELGMQESCSEEILCTWQQYNGEMHLYTYVRGGR